MGPKKQTSPVKVQKTVTLSFYSKDALSKIEKVLGSWATYVKEYCFWIKCGVAKKSDYQITVNEFNLIDLHQVYTKLQEEEFSVRSKIDWNAEITSQVQRQENVVKDYEMKLKEARNNLKQKKELLELSNQFHGMKEFIESLI